MNKTKKIIAYVLVFAMILLTVPSENMRAEAATKLKKIMLNKSFCVMKKGKRTTLKVSYTPKKVKGKISWKSSNKKVATVSKKGVVTAKKNGKATITAKIQGKKASCKVKVGTPVKSINVAYKSIKLEVGKKATILAGVSPKNASVKTLKYTSKNKKVATVSSKGVVKAVNVGTTYIIVKAADGNNASKKVKVIVEKKKQAATSTTQLKPSVSSDTTNTKPDDTTITKPDNTTNTKPDDTTNTKPDDTTNTKPTTSDKKEKGVVGTNEEIVEALKDSTIKTLTLKTDQNVMLTIPEGTYEDVELIVEMPNGEVENNGVFKKVTINQIAENTYIENASGNELLINSPKSHIIIKNAADAKITIGSAANNTQIENNGTVSKMQVESSGNVEVTGDSTEAIPTNILSEVKIATNQTLQVSAIKKFNMTVNPGAEKSTVTVKVEAEIPNVSGVGMIPVTIEATGEIEDIVCENNATEETIDLSKVTFTGNIVDTTNAAMKDTNVYVVPYTKDYDVTKIADDSNAVKEPTDAEGNYKFEDLKTGNYILVAKKDGFLDTVQTLIITSIYGANYANEKIVMLPKKRGDQPGSVSGKVYNSQGNAPIENLTVRIRNNRNNVSGKAFLETTTDSEGNYTIDELSAGYYTIQVVDKRENVAAKDVFLSTYINVAVLAGEDTADQNIGLCQKIEGEQIRFVTEWEGSKEIGSAFGVDPHLLGPAENERGEFHLYPSSNSTYMENGVEYAKIEKCDSEYNGTSVVNVSKVVSGKYQLYLEDYANEGSVDCDELSKTDLSVEVYVGNTKMATYYMPKKDGNVWHVCDYNSNTKQLESDEEVSYHYGDSSDYGKPTLETKLTSAYYELLYLSLDAIDSNSCYTDATKEKIKEKYEELTKEYKEILMYDSTEEERQAQDFDELETNGVDKLESTGFDVNKILPYCQKVEDFYVSVESELKVKVTGDNILKVSNVSGSKIIYVTKDASIEGKINFQFGVNQYESTEVSKDDGNHYTVKYPSGNEANYTVIERLDLDKMVISGVKVSGKDVDYDECSYTDDKGNVQDGLYIYNTSLSMEDFTSDCEVTGSAQGVTINVLSSGIVEATYKNSTREWKIFIQNMPGFEDTENKIYDIQYHGDGIYVYGENAELGDSYKLSVPENLKDSYILTDINKTYKNNLSVSLEKKDGTDSRKIWIHYIPLGKRVKLLGAYGDYENDPDAWIEGITDEENKTLTFKGKCIPDSFELCGYDSRNIMKQNFNTDENGKYMVDSDGMLGTVEIYYRGSQREIKESIKTYKVYFIQE